MSGNSGWTYARASTNSGSSDYKKYKSKLGGENWVIIGTAKQMWNKEATGCTKAQREKIRKDMESAESKALTF